MNALATFAGTVAAAGLVMLTAAGSDDLPGQTVLPGVASSVDIESGGADFVFEDNTASKGFDLPGDPPVNGPQLLGGVAGTLTLGGLCVVVARRAERRGGRS